MKKFLILLLSVAILGGLIFYVYNKGEKPKVEETKTETEEEISNGHLLAYGFYNNETRYSIPHKNDLLYDSTLLVASHEKLTYADFVFNYVNDLGLFGQFYWKGFKEMEDVVITENNMFIIHDSEQKYNLIGSINTMGVDPEKTFLTNSLYTAEQYTMLASPSTPYIKGSEIYVNKTDERITVIFQVAAKDNSMLGYTLFIIDKNYPVCLQVEYLEKTEVYNQMRCKDIIESIDFDDADILNRGK